MHKVVVRLSDDKPYSVFIKHFNTEEACRAYVLAMREMMSYTGYDVDAKINGKEA